MEQLSTLTEVMREYYLDAVDEVFNYDLTIYGDLEKTAEGFQGGKSIAGPLWIAYNERGVGNRLEGETLPTAGANEYDTWSATVKYIYGIFSMTGQAMKMTKGTNTLIDESKKVMNGLLNALKWDLERQFWGNGDGWIATIATGGITGDVITWSGDLGVFFKRGMYIDSYTSGGTKHLDSAKILDVDYVNKKITVNAIGTAAVGDYICREDCVTWSGSAFVSRDLSGLKKIISDAATTFEGIDATSNSWWKAIVDEPLAARDMDELDIMAWLDNIVAISGEPPSALFGSLGMRRSFKNMLNSTNQSAEVIPTRSGFKKGMCYTYDGKDIPMIGSRHCWANKLAAINFDHIWIVEGSKLDWDNLGGGIIKPRETTDTYFGRLSWYPELVCDHRPALGYYGNVNEL